MVLSAEVCLIHIQVQDAISRTERISSDARDGVLTTSLMTSTV
jgi:hypothetical protein